MSDSTYPSLATSNQRSIDEHGRSNTVASGMTRNGDTEFYDGVIELEKAWNEGLKPDPMLLVSEWADQFRVLSPKSAAEPGRWRTQRTPYLQEIMDCLSVSSPVQRVVFMKGAQVGGTEAGNNWIGYVIHMAPGPMMAVSPTVEMAKRNSRQRIDPQLDPILLAERRSATFARRRKVLLVSTPTLKSTSRIQREFENSDQRYFYVPCPSCGHSQPLRFSQLRWEEGKPENAQYCCEDCDFLISEHQKTEMLNQGYWQATAEGDGQTQGYHLSSLYSPVGWFSWEDAARIFEGAQQNPDLMKGFVNTVLGESYEEEFEAPEWERLYKRRESYAIGVVPEGGLFLTAGVDVQRDRLECEIVAWGRNKESWSIDYLVLDGDTALPDVWKKLDQVLSKDWPHALGSSLPIRVMCVDSGYATQDVYGWVRNYPQAVWGGAGARASQPRSVVAIKGRDTETALIQNVSKADAGGKRRGLRVWNVSGPVAKVELYRWLKLPRPTDEERASGELFSPGTCHFPQYGEEYFKQLTAERRIIRLHKGFPKATWEKDPTRNNEALDCRVYARAAASIYGLDRFKELQWKRLENALGEVKQKALVQSESAQPITKKTTKAFRQRSSVVADDPYL